ncbi:hypothetical protein [Pseudomonas putida]|uniref:hypothetical protein n=1 Tax=Pseudomonas putida TaxID=303 RepID=UPI00163D4EF6|nr:hypothetical protein [Pseudomonas putida]
MNGPVPVGRLNTLYASTQVSAGCPTSFKPTSGQKFLPRSHSQQALAPKLSAGNERDVIGVFVLIAIRVDAHPSAFLQLFITCLLQENTSHTNTYRFF